MDFIRQTVLKYPHEVTLISVAPLTNLGVLFTLDPDIARLLKRVIIMGCKVDNHPDFVGRLDWNVLCDPIAAKIVLDADISELIIYPCDVTYKLHHSPDYLKTHVKGKYRELIEAMSEVWFERFDGYSYHDPMAAAYAFRPELVQVQRGQMRVDLMKSGTLSYTAWQPLSKGHHAIACELDEDGFLEELYTHLNREEEQ